MSKSEGRESDFPIGCQVRSHYRARWKGTVIGYHWTRAFGKYGPSLCLEVRQEIDRCGRPIRNKKVVVYNHAYFKRI